MTNPAPDYIQNTPAAPVHTEPADPNSAFTLPFTPAQLVQIGIQLVEGFLAKVVTALTGGFAPGISAFVQLSGWAVTTLPAMILAPLQSLISALVSVLAPFPIVGNVVTDLASAFGLLNDNTTVAQSTADGAQGSANVANTGVAILNARVNGIIAGGATYSDTFSRTGSNTLGSDYTLKYGAAVENLDNSGSGTVGTDPANSGTTVWTPSGFADRTWAAINTVNPMTTNRSRVSIVVSPFTFAGAGNQENVYLIGRADATLDNFVIARIGNLDVSGPGTCEIGYVKAGVYARFGSVTGGLDLGHDDLWDFEVGTAADDDQFRLLQNNALRVDVTDLGHDAHKDVTPGTTYIYTGTGEDCGIGAGPFGVTYQQSPPNIQVLAAADF
jgi:hypothetical protein